MGCARGEHVLLVYHISLKAAALTVHTVSSRAAALSSVRFHRYHMCSETVAGRVGYLLVDNVSWH